MGEHATDVELLASRIRALEDERAICDLVGDYAFLADSGQHEAWVQLFTEDGEVELLGREVTGTYGDHASWAGHEQLRRFISDPDVHMSIQGRCMHLTTGNIRIHVDGDEGTADAYYVVLVREQGRNVVANCGFTRLTVRRTSQGWRIRRRRRHIMGTDAATLRAAFPPARPVTPID